MSNTQKSEALRLAHLLALDKWPDAATELRRQHARILELEASESRTITQRDRCEEVINRMADAVLGKDRPEWTSNYDYMNAAQEVEDRIAELNSEATENARIIGASAETELALRGRIAELKAQLSACIKLLKKAPKINQSLYVGTDQQSWGMQAKAVLDAAIAAQAKKGV